MWERRRIRRRRAQFISQCRSQIHQLGQDFEELEKLAGERDLPRDVLQTIHHMTLRQRLLGLSETQLREHLNQLQELHISPEHRVQPDLDCDHKTESSG
jgi:hypothetical protein